MPKSKKKYASKNTLSLLFIALPGITYLIINNYIPIVGTFIAFKKFSYAKGIWGSPWCGLDNFKFLFLTDDAWVITRNTLLYNLAFIVIGTVVSVIFAILLHELGELLRGKLFQSVLLFPHLLSWVVTAYLVYALLGSTTGFVNNTILDALGKKGVDWYTAKTAWPFILVIVYLWKNAGYNAIVYMAGIAGIDKEIYEAAKIDGCSYYTIFTKIIFPLMVPTMITGCIFSFMWRWDDFLAALLYLSDPLKYPVSYALKMFSDPTAGSDWGAMFAMATLSLIPIFVIFLTMQKYLVEGIASTGIKG